MLTIKEHKKVTEGQKSVIEINGNKYDAHSGRMVSSAPSHKSMDMITIQKKSGKSQFAPKRSPVNSDVPHVTAAHKLQKSHILMRQAVRKPFTVTADNSYVKQSSATASIVRPGLTNHVDEQARISRANHVPMSSSVRRFDVSPPQTHVRVAPMALASAPAQIIDRVPQPVAHHPIQQSGSESFIQKQLSTINSTVEPESPFKKKPVHKRTASAIKQHKFMSFSAVLASFVMLAGFLLYMNMPTVALAMASQKSGLAVKSPSSVPKSFYLERNVYATSGQVTMSYKTRSDDRRFSITLLKVDQTKETLKEEIITKTKGQYQVYETNSLTLYLSTPSNSSAAEWLNNGVRYSIRGNSGMTTEQLASMASAL